MIYLDNSATTQMYTECLEEFCRVSEECYFNASAGYHAGIRSRGELDSARQVVARALGCEDSEVYFTASGTESDNIAIFGGAKLKKSRLITSISEHPAVYNCFLELKNRGYDVQFVQLNSDSSVNMEHFESLLTPNVGLVSIMHVNNETGVINDISRIATLCKQVNPMCLVHSDGVQAFLKVPLNVKNMGVDMYSVSAHKVHGAKGVGALYIKDKVHLTQVLFGGGQERGVRSGTENVAGIVAFAKACELSEKHRKEGCLIDYKKAMKGILSQLPDVLFNADCLNSAPNILSVSIKGIRSEVLQQMLSAEGIYIGKGSACSSKIKTSRLLTALHMPKAYAEGTIRISIGYLNTLEECQIAAERILAKVTELRKLIR